MYNNVGIRTPRGSGTSGHVMSNRRCVSAGSGHHVLDQQRLVSCEPLMYIIRSITEGE